MGLFDWWRGRGKGKGLKGEGAGDILNETAEGRGASEKEELIWHCMQSTIKVIAKHTQSDGSCVPFNLKFEYPGTSNDGLLTIERSRSKPNAYTLRLSLLRRGTDMLVSNYMKSGTIEDVVAYLSSRESLPEMLLSCQHLSDSVDSRW